MKSTFLSLTKMNSDLTVKVAVENTTYVFDKLFDYLVPSAFTDLVQVGKRVLIPFGRGNKKKQGIIFELSAVSDDISAEKLKSVCSVLDDEPVLSEELLKLAEFMKEHYFCTYYDAVKTMLPAGINYKITTLYGVREGINMGIAPTRAAARQLVGHKHITVDGKVVNIPSYAVKPGQIVGVRERSKSLEVIANSLAGFNHSKYPWLEWDDNSKVGKLLHVPERADIPENIKEHLIVELYSK